MAPRSPHAPYRAAWPLRILYVVRDGFLHGDRATLESFELYETDRRYRPAHDPQTWYGKDDAGDPAGLEYPHGWTPKAAWAAYRRQIDQEEHEAQQLIRRLAVRRQEIPHGT